MKKLIIAIIAAMVLTVTAGAITAIPETTCKYYVTYHWGVINKVAGTGYVTYHSAGNRFTGQLSGHSIPWGGKIYTVRTELTADFVATDNDGVTPETIVTQQGVYSKPHVGKTEGNEEYKDIQGGGTLDASPQTMEAVTIMSDMLSIFYYAHTLDFDAMKSGQSITIPVIKDGVNENLYLTYEGTSDYETWNYTTPAYKIVFRYTYDGKPDSYPVTCLIS